MKCSLGLLALLGDCGGVMPPTDLYIDGVHAEPPPWLGDSIRIVVHQPDAAAVVRWVQVQR